MMRFSINVNKKHVFIIIALFVIAGFGIAQQQTLPTPNPGHNSGEILVRAITQSGHPTFLNQSLESWLGWLGGNVLDNGQSITNLQTSTSSLQLGINNLNTAVTQLQNNNPAIPGTVVGGGIDGILCWNTAILWGVGASCVTSGGTYLFTCPAGSTKHITGYRSIGTGTYDLVYICVKD